jgi:hypothetical protein
LRNIEIILKETDIILHELNISYNQWIIFYQKLFSTFSQRNKMNESEFREISKLRELMDGFFIFNANLNNISRDSKFIQASFYSLNPQILVSYKREKSFLSNFLEIINSLGKLLEENSIPNNDFLQQTISTDEIKKFEKEYLEINLYFKNYITIIKKKSEQSRLEYQQNLTKLRSEIDMYRKLNERMENQKNNLLQVLKN